MMKPISFVLNKEEVKQGLLLSGAIKERGKKSIIQAILCGILAVVYIVDIFINPQSTMSYFLLAVCLILVPVVIILPRKTDQSIVDAHTDGANITVSKEEGKLIIEATSPETPPYAWSIEGENVQKVLETEEIFLFILKDRRALVIPKRACDSEQIEQITNTAKEFLENLGE